jgi:hypothetical protein
MRIVDLISESLHDVIAILKSDARQLEDVGTISLKEDWEDDLPRLAHRYDKEVRRVRNSFGDPEGADERDWIDAHMEATRLFLVTHGLADENV